MFALANVKGFFVLLLSPPALRVGAGCDGDLSHSTKTHLPDYNQILPAGANGLDVNFDFHLSPLTLTLS